MSQRPPSSPTLRLPEPNPPGVRHRALWILLIFVAVAGLFWWVLRRNPSSHSKSTVQMKGFPSNLPSGPRNGGPLASVGRGHQVPGPDPARKVDEEVARILRGDYITNIYTLSSNTTMVEEAQYPPIFRKFGTEEFETLAKAACEKNLTRDPFAAEYLEILEEHPAARDSGRIYSGIYLLLCMGCDRSERYQIQHNMILDREEKVENANKIAELELREQELRSIRYFSDSEIAMDRLKQQAQIDRTKRLLEYLYGDLPKAVFQRLVSIEPAQPPDRIPDP
jgi:hypothetical protein